MLNFLFFTKRRDNFKTKVTSLIQKLFFFSSVLVVQLIPFEQTVWAVSSINSSVHSSSVSQHSLPFKYVKKFKSINKINNSWQAYKNPQYSFLTSSLNRIPTLDNGEMALPSNANNFHGQLSANVDPRTGRSSFTTTLGSMLFDNGYARRELKLSYSASPSPSFANPLSTGSEWSFNVGTEHPSTTEVAGHRTTDITISDGHSFTMESERGSKGNAIWHLFRHKLNDVFVVGHPGDWTVSTATGVREHIKNGYEDWEEGKNGRRVWLYYDRNSSLDAQRRLKYICAHPLTQSQLKNPKNSCTDAGFWLTYQQNNIVVHGIQNVVLNFDFIAGYKQLKSITMPGFSSTGISNYGKSTKLNFSYDLKGGFPWLLHSVESPTGITSTFLYNTETSKSKNKTNGLLVNNEHSTIPVVTELITHDKFSKTVDQHTWYSYNVNRADQHNYTGYQSGSLLIPGKDNLIDRPNNYTYSVLQDNGLMTKTSTYNKYHLLLKEITVSDTTGNLVIKDQKKYSPWQNTTFSQLSSVYSLPQNESQVFFTNKVNGLQESHSVIKESRYDQYGQPIWKRDSLGAQTFIEYCGKKADSHCQKPLNDWPQMPLPKKIINIPAPTLDTNVAEKPYASETIYDYTNLHTEPHFRAQMLHHRELLTTLDHRGDNTQVKVKTQGMLPLDQVKALNPGDKLPELNSAQITKRSTYEYNKNINDNNYGQVNAVTMEKYTTGFLKKNYQLMGLSNFINSKHTPKKEVLKFKIVRNENKKTGERLITTVVDNSYPSNVFQPKQELTDVDDFNLGSKIYSTNSGLELSENDPLKALHTTWIYDNWMRPIKKMVTTNDKKIKIATWKYILTNTENSEVVTDPGGMQQKFVMNGRMKVISAWYRFKNKNNQQLEGFSGWIEKEATKYNGPGGLKSEVTKYTIGKNDNRIPLTTKYGYDESSRPVWVESPDGQISVTLHDDAGMRTYMYHVVSGADHKNEKLGYLLKVADANLKGQPTTAYILPLDPNVKRDGKLLYSNVAQQKLKLLKSTLSMVDSLKTTNSHGLLSSTKVIDFVKEVINAHQWYTKTSFVYDGVGNKIKQVMGDGATTQWVYDHQNNLIATVMPDKRIIHDEYDIRGNKTFRCIYVHNNSTCHPLGYKEYDNAGNLIKQTDETGKSVKYSYDKDSRMIKKELPATKDSPFGHIVTFKYNSIGLIEKDIDGEPYVINHYDSSSWTLTDTEDHVSHIHFEYDPNTRLPIKEIRTAPQKLRQYQGIDYPKGTTTFVWDKFGNLKQMTDDQGNRYIQKHDNLGRITLKQVYLHGSLKPINLVNIKYDLYSQPIKITTGAGITKIYSYNNLGQVSLSTESKNGKPFESIAYGYNADNGNIISLTRSEGNLSSKNYATATEYFSYDITGNLKSMKCNSSTGENKNLCPRDIDTAGSGLTVPPVILSQNYNFDVWNNISQVIEKVKGSKNRIITKTTKYVYAASKDNKLQPELYDPHRMMGFYQHWSTQSFDAKPRTITYDNLGRIIVDASGNKLHYNALGQQDEFVNYQTKDVVKYFYDSHGNQIAEQSFYGKGKNKGQPIQKTLYMFYSGNKITKQIQKDNSGKVHVSEELQGIAHVEDGVIKKWYLYDHKGDVVSIADNFGRIIADNVYSPYGMKYNVMNTSSQVLNDSININKQSPWWQAHEPGFDGQMTDSATGYQFLGGGYRAYNPIYRHFMSKDSFSPFKEIDGYGFVRNNPISNVDPTGHISGKVLGYFWGATTIAMSAAMAFIFPVLGSLGSMTLDIGSSLIATTNNPLLTAAIPLLYSSVAGLTGAAAGSLQIASTAKPKSQALAAAGSYLTLATSVIFLMGDVYTLPSAVKLSSNFFDVKSIAFSGNFILASQLANIGANITGTASVISSSFISGKNKKLDMARQILSISSGAFGVMSLGASLGALAIAPVSIKAGWEHANMRKGHLQQELDEMGENVKFSSLKDFAVNPNLHGSLFSGLDDRFVSESGFYLNRAVYSYKTGVAYIESSDSLLADMAANTGDSFIKQIKSGITKTAETRMNRPIPYDTVFKLVTNNDMALIYHLGGVASTDRVSMMSIPVNRE